MCPLRSLNNSYWLDHYSFVFIKASTGQQSNDHNHVVMRRFSSTVALFSSHMTIYFLSFIDKYRKLYFKCTVYYKDWCIQASAISLSSNSCVCFCLSLLLSTHKQMQPCAHTPTALWHEINQKMSIFSYLLSGPRLPSPKLDIPCYQLISTWLRGKGQQWFKVK